MPRRASRFFSFSPPPFPSRLQGQELILERTVHRKSRVREALNAGLSSLPRASSTRASSHSLFPRTSELIRAFDLDTQPTPPLCLPKL